jgi:hypothetical protein
MHNDIYDVILVSIAGICFLLSGINEFFILISIISIFIFACK